MLAVSAWQLRRGETRRCSRRSAKLRSSCCSRCRSCTLLVGSQLGVIEAKYQPMKIAAAEAQWTTCQPCSFSAVPDRRRQATTRPRPRSSQIPHLLSLLATGTWNGKVVGLDELQAQYEQQYGPGDYVPNVFIQYWSMRVMAYLGSLVPLLALWGCGCAARAARDLPGVPAGRDLGGARAVRR